MEPGGTALVTGASRGIGRAVALELAGRGFSVVATMRDPSEGTSLLAEGRDSLCVERLDVTDPASIRIPDDLRVLVNNAGFQDAYLPVEALPLDLHRALPVLRQRGEGVVCTISSSAILLASPFYGAYRASKAAISALCETLYVELAPFGIRTVEIVPGPVDTRGLAHSSYLPAVEVAPYRGMAERMMAGRARISEVMVSPAEAAVRIVDTILDDAAPLKSACDPMGDAMLETWRHSTDQELLDRARDRYST
jgi:NAD(P)-dependent dehydrogenase (short-subunit alcohol dehydrogenase family)